MLIGKLGETDAMRYFSVFEIKILTPCATNRQSFQRAGSSQSWYLPVLVCPGKQRLLRRRVIERDLLIADSPQNLHHDLQHVNRITAVFEDRPRFRLRRLSKIQTVNAAGSSIAVLSHLKCKGCEVKSGLPHIKSHNRALLGCLPE